MKFNKVVILSTILSILLFPLSSTASSLDQLPSSKLSKDWEVVIDKPKSNELKPKPDVYNIYSLDIKYIGDEAIKMERIEAYRDDPGSSVDFELFTSNLGMERNVDQQTFHHQNFPISVKATDLKVIVTWANKGDNSRKFKEVFIFKQ
ncbi:hypothetical protein D4T97_005165 [Siminovitchia acidinfaciens]|uniref:Uncharacterized protein n=1 Tax=Siminovitchia acidinfaciens TaxID=2321395 RepID=A0A429Y424_9BACI|nr:hypothetical protein [Siminovitchia acidinfaciens]RST76174.1 hypothetical protein D4T97_005165 [Siminovitchia acidinfaciens]